MALFLEIQLGFLVHLVFLLVLCVFLQPYKPIIYIGHRAVLSLTLRHACSLSSFFPIAVRFTLIAMEGMLRVVTAMSRYPFFKITIFCQPMLANHALSTPKQL